MSSAPAFLPSNLRSVLDMRSSDHACPASVEAAMAAIPYFKRGAPKAHVPYSNNRFGNVVKQSSDGFRQGGWRSSNSSVPVDDDGFTPVRNRGLGRGGITRRVDSYAGAYGHGYAHKPARVEPRTEVRTEVRTETPKAPEAPKAPEVPTEAPEARDDVVKFSSAAIKAVDVEDRILSKVKGKINKIGHSTYDATKAFMQQILDSDETAFLDEFMKFVFQKAATESAFCPLYAKLLHELADEFTYLRKVMVSLFHDYIDIFTEVESAPDVGSGDYRAFLDSQERKKFRRGYSQFVAELVKLGEADIDAFAKILQEIVTVLEKKHTNATDTLLCEEYIDCLANLCGCASSILSGASWSAAIKDRISALSKKPRAEVPGFTNKARFALMDLVDSANRGWN
jgi:hypothetical protein